MRLIELLKLRSEPNAGAWFFWGVDFIVASVIICMRPFSGAAWGIRFFWG